MTLVVAILDVELSESNLLNEYTRTASIPVPELECVNVDANH